MITKPITAFCSLNMGQSPDSKTYNTDGVGMPFYQGNADFGDLHPVTRVWCSQPVKKAKPGDILISVRAPIGAMNIATEACCIGRGLAALTPNADTRQKYLYYAIQSRVDSLIAQGTGSTFKAISKKILEETLIPDYSPSEQDEIVTKIGLIDSAIASRQEQLQLLDQLVKSRFIELFEGESYVQVSFGDICCFLRNGANIKQTKGAGGFPITRIETLSNDVFNTDRLGYADITDLQRYENYVLHKGDILISHINSVAYLGRAVQYKGQLDSPIIHGMNLLCARLLEGYDPTYVEWFFKTPRAKDYISTITKKAVNQASITTTDLKGMQIPSPPIELQRQFAAFVEQTDKSKFLHYKALSCCRSAANLYRQEWMTCQTSVS